MNCHFQIFPEKGKLIVILLLLFPFLADAIWVYWENHQWRQSSTLSLYSLGYLIFSCNLSVCPAEDLSDSDDIVRIPLECNLGYCGDLEYRKRSGKIRFYIISKSPSFIASGKRYAFFCPSDSAQENELRSFIQKNEEELTDIAFQKKIRSFLARHKEKLKEIGGGDFRFGLQREKVIETIKSGKDPEAEWRKKYPAKQQ